MTTKLTPFFFWDEQQRGKDHHVTRLVSRTTRRTKSILCEWHHQDHAGSNVALLLPAYYQYIQFAPILVLFHIVFWTTIRYGVGGKGNSLLFRLLQPQSTKKDRVAFFFFVWNIGDCHHDVLLRQQYVVLSIFIIPLYKGVWQRMVRYHGLSCLKPQSKSQSVQRSYDTYSTIVAKTASYIVTLTAAATWHWSSVFTVLRQLPLTHDLTKSR